MWTWVIYKWLHFEEVSRELLGNEVLKLRVPDSNYTSQHSSNRFTRRCDIAPIKVMIGAHQEGSSIDEMQCTCTCIVYTDYHILFIYAFLSNP